MNKTVEKPRGRPPKSRLGFADTRETLIRSGIELLTERGFNNTGIDQILKKVNVPKGSFYHYFKSKEAFGCIVIESYSAYFVNKLQKHLLQKELPALQRLQAFMDDAMQGMERYAFKRGCLIGNMTQELANTHDHYRDLLEAVFERWSLLIADCLELAREEGVLTNPIPSDQLARFFWIGWEGAVMHAKLTRNTEPMQLFAQHFMYMLRNRTP